MPEIIVESSFIESVAYFADEVVMEIQLKSGNRYLYIDVSPEVFADFLDAESHGEFYNEKIKGVFASLKMPT